MAADKRGQIEVLARTITIFWCVDPYYIRFKMLKFPVLPGLCSRKVLVFTAKTW